MTAKTTTAHYKATPEDLFAFVSNIENLPKWATGFCKSIRKEGEHYIITTPGGEMYQRFDVDPKTGKLDMYAGPTLDQMWCWPTRITPDNMGGSVFSFTCIQMPNQGDEEFGAQCLTLHEELENIRQIVDGASA